VLAFNASHRRVLVWTLVVGTHVFVIFLLSHEREWVSVSRKAPIDDALLFVELPAIASADETRPPIVAKPGGVNSPVAPIRPSAQTGVLTPTPPAIPAEPAIDWSAAARQAAEHAVAKQGAAAQRGFGTLPVSPYRDCKKKKLKEWRPEQKAGFAGGLPYVRVSKHCIVGLPFFACAIGALPPPKSDLFEDMESNKQSSVPGDDDCVEAAPPVAQPLPAGTAPHE